MKKSIKILALLLVLIMMVGCFAGCAKDPVDTTPKDTTPKDTTPKDTQGTTAAPTTTEPKDYKDVDFNVWWWGGEPRNTNTALAIEEFDKKYLNLETSISFAGWGDYWKAVDMAVAGNTLPDVMQQDFQTVYTYASAGKLLALDEYIESGRIDMSDVSEENINLGRFYDDKVYAIATGVNTWTMAYRPDILEKAGVELPDSKLFTVEEFIEVAKKVYDATGVKAYYTEVDYIWGSGMDKYNEDGTEPGFTAELFADWLKIQREGIEYGYILNGSDPVDNVDQAFYQGFFWCRGAYSNIIPTYSEQADTEVSWFAIPSVNGSELTSHAKPTMYWSIAADTENLDLALDCVNFLLKSEEYFELCGLDRGLPIFGDVREMLKPTMTDLDKVAEEIVATQIELGNLSHPPYNAEYASQAYSLVTDAYWENQFEETAPKTDAERLERAEQLIEDMLYVLGGGEM